MGLLASKSHTTYDIIVSRFAAGQTKLCSRMVHLATISAEHNKITHGNSLKLITIFSANLHRLLYPMLALLEARSLFASRWALQKTCKECSRWYSFNILSSLMLVSQVPKDHWRTISWNEPTQVTEQWYEQHSANTICRGQGSRVDLVCKGRNAFWEGFNLWCNQSNVRIWDAGWQGPLPYW